MKIAITGATGFIGRHFINYLEDKDVKIVKFDKRYHSLNHKEKLINFVRGADVVFHFAGIRYPKNTYELQINTLGTWNLLQTIKEMSPLPRLVFTSSFAVYAPSSKKNTVINESYKTFPSTEYGLSKLLAEEIIEFYSKTYGIKSIIMRISNAYGPNGRNSNSVLDSFIEKFKRSGEVLLTVNGDGRQTRDFIFVDDIIRALWLAATVKLKKNFTIINICSGEETSILDLIKILEKESKKKAKIKFNKGKSIFEKKSYWKGDNTLAKEILGWEPKISIREGLKLAVSGENL